MHWANFHFLCFFGVKNYCLQVQTLCLIPTKFCQSLPVFKSTAVLVLVPGHRQIFSRVKTQQQRQSERFYLALGRGKNGVLYQFDWREWFFNIFCELSSDHVCQNLNLVT